MNRVFLVFALFLTFAMSCKSLKYNANKTTIETIETVRDSLIWIPADTVTITVKAECDSLQNVVFTRVESSTFPERVQYVTRNNTITVSVPVDSFAVYVALKDRYTVEAVQAPPKKAKPTFWIGLSVGLAVVLIFLISWLIRSVKR